MRYMLLSYIKRPTGKVDEVMTLAKRLRAKDLQMHQVILDFRDRKVVLASMGGTTVPKDFNRITSYYRQYYRETIDDLCAAHGYQIIASDSAADLGVKPPEHH